MVTIAVVGTLSKRNPGQFLKFARQLDEQPTDSHTESIALISDSAMPLCTHNHSYGKPLQTIANPATRFPPCHEGQKGNSLSDAHQSSLHRGLILRTMPPKYADIHKILSASSSSSFLRTKQKQPVREAVKTKGEDWGVASPKCRRGVVVTFRKGTFKDVVWEFGFLIISSVCSVSSCAVIDGMVRVLVDLVGKTLELKLVAPARRRLNTHYSPTRTSCVDLCGRHCGNPTAHQCSQNALSSLKLPARLAKHCARAHE